MDVGRMAEKRPKIGEPEIRCEGPNCTVDLREAMRLELEAKMERLRKNG